MLLSLLVVSASVVSARECGKMSADVDHAAEAKKWSSKGDKECVLAHRQQDANKSEDADACKYLRVRFLHHSFLCVFTRCPSQITTLQTHWKIWGFTIKRCCRGKELSS
jgi:hypothetical protein